MLDFPNNPISGQTYTGPNGVIWVWDTQKWVNGTTIGTAYAPINSPVFTGNPQSVTPPSGDADASVATTAFVAAAIPGASYADNGGFAVNQRAYVTGTALAAAAFGHDRWKAGAAGCTYTFAASSGPSRSITITAGTLQQIVEGAALAGGNYMLSWAGTAQGRVGAGSYAASPVTASGIVAGTNTTIEFNAGTLSQVKFEAGSTATPWQAVPPQQQLAQCQRFYQVGNISLRAYAATGNYISMQYTFPVRFRAIPTVVITPVSGSAGLGAGVVSGSPQLDMFQVIAPSTATGDLWLNDTFTASADL